MEGVSQTAREQCVDERIRLPSLAEDVGTPHGIPLIVGGKLECCEKAGIVSVGEVPWETCETIWEVSGNCSKLITGRVNRTKGTPAYLRYQPPGCPYHYQTQVLS